jgi:hypothetical protein
MPTEKNIKTPNELYKHFESYCKECKKEPRKENYWSNRAEKQITLDREKPLTWHGFEIWLRKKGILAKLQDYKENKDKRYTEYAYIIHAIGQEIYEDKFTGAAVGIYHNNIIARDLGLKDQAVHEIEDKRKSIDGLFPKETELDEQEDKS